MTTENNLLPLAEFKQVVQNAPLFSMDLVVVNSNSEILVGERLNAPAKGYWFVPGGRIYKNESLENAFKRISKTELGMEIERKQAWLLGLFDHFYEDSFFGADISTHYINATHVIRLTEQKLSLPNEQHSRYRWIELDRLMDDSQVHKFSKVFLSALKRYIQKENKL